MPNNYVCVFLRLTVAKWSMLLNESTNYQLVLEILFAVGLINRDFHEQF